MLLPIPQTVGRQLSFAEKQTEMSDPVTTLAGSGTAGYADGRGAQASFNCPTGVAIDGEGHVVVADNSNHRVRKIESTDLVPPGGTAVPKGSTVVEDLLRMLSSEKHADVTFSVEGQLIRAHRCVLCARSEYFETMLGSQFREGEGSSMGQPLPVRPHAHTHACTSACRQMRMLAQMRTPFTLLQPHFHVHPRQRTQQP